MSKYYAAVLVTFDKDVHEEAIEQRLNAIRMIRGVRSVKPLEADPMAEYATERMKYELWEKSRDALFPEKKS